MSLRDSLGVLPTLEGRLPREPASKLAARFNVGRYEQVRTLPANGRGLLAELYGWCRFKYCRKAMDSKN